MADQTSASLGAALEREHREIDEGIEEFRSGLAAGVRKTEPLTRAAGALRRHIYLEEEFLFPPLRAAGLMAPLFVMVREHGEMWRTLDTLQAKLADGSASAPVLDTCGQLVAGLESHNSKEEAIIYPQADVVLSASVTAELRAFLDSGSMPDGWVCQGAQSN